MPNMPSLQAKVFSRFDALREALKNYTMDATPDNRSSVLQQVFLHELYQPTFLNCSAVVLLRFFFRFSQGGMFVFKGKELIYAHKDEGTGDHAPLDDVFKSCYQVLSS